MDAILTVRLKREIKEKATKTLSSKGLTASVVVQQLFDEIVKTGEVPFIKASKRPSREEIEQRLQAMRQFHTKHPLNITDDEIRAARMKDKYDIDVG